MKLNINLIISHIEREKRERENSVDNRLPLYIELPRPPEKPKKEIEYVIDL